VNTRALFAGRWNQITTVVDAVSQIGLHVVIFGERGVGKSSLANIIRPVLDVLDQQTPHIVVRVNAHQSDTFASVWVKALDEVQWVEDKPQVGFNRTPGKVPVRLRSAMGLSDDLTIDDIRRTLAQLPDSVFVIDEFDRLPRRHAAQFTDLIKTLSDSAVPSTLILVGVAETVEGLIKDHASISRALVQVPMPRMTIRELREILQKAGEQLGMAFDEAAASRIARMSQGLPHYTHLVGLHSVRKAAERFSYVVSTDDVSRGFETAVKQADHTVADAYSTAVHSAHSTAIYSPVLLAAAVTACTATGESMGYFQPASVVGPLERILGRAVQIATFNGHLAEFMSEKRGRILERAGSPRAYRYRFRDPLLPPHVIMRGIAAAKITPEVMEELLAGADA